jgi:DNA-binding transcriptional LysR family regulator
VVPQLIGRLARDLPQVQLAVRHLTSAEQLGGLLAGTLDLALVREATPVPRLELSEVHRAPVMAVFPERHPLAEADVVDLAALAGEPFVLWSRRGAPAFHDALLAACAVAGFTPRVAHRVRGVDARLSYIAAGLGVGLEDASYAPLRRAGVVFRPLLGEPAHASIHLARRRHQLPAAAGRVVSMLTANRS